MTSPRPQQQCLLLWGQLLAVLLGLIGLVLSCFVLARCDMFAFVSGDTEFESMGLFYFQPMENDGIGGLVKRDYCITYKDLGASVARDAFLESQQAARIFGVIAVVFGSITVLSSFVIAWSTNRNGNQNDGETSEPVSPVPWYPLIGLYLVCCLLQGLTFLFFNSEYCDREGFHCPMQTAGILDIIATSSYLLASIVSYLTKPTTSAVTRNDKEDEQHTPPVEEAAAPAKDEEQQSSS